MLQLCNAPRCPGAYLLMAGPDQQQIRQHRNAKGFLDPSLLPTHLVFTQAQVGLEFPISTVSEQSLLYIQRNRSPYENRNHAAACDCISQAGRRDGAASPCRAASWAAVRSSSTLRFWCFNVATTVIILSTKREPASLWVPKLPLRHCTPGRIARSALFCVGSTPATCTKVHNAWRRFRISWHVPSVLATPHWLPASNSRSTSRRRGVIEERNGERANLPSRTRCHHVNSWCACARRASPMSSEAPPRLRIASKSRSRCVQHS